MDAYDIVTRLGSGACGSVYLVKSKSSSRLLAMKKIQLDERRKTRTKSAVLKEANILAELKHPNIVAYHESFFDAESEHLCIVQDYCDGGTLDEKITEAEKTKSYFPEKRIMQWFIQLSMAVQYMHSKKILHRDLKAQNVFLTKTSLICKLGDFGISKMMDATIDLASTCVGTPCYLSPEMCQDIPYSSKADVWALGCLLYEMCALHPAFHANNLISLFYKIVQGDANPLPDRFSDALQGVVSALLVKKPDDRPSARQVLKLPYVQEMLQSYIDEKANQIRHKAARDSPAYTPHLTPTHSPLPHKLSPHRQNSSTHDDNSGRAQHQPSPFSVTVDGSFLHAQHKDQPKQHHATSVEPLITTSLSPLLASRNNSILTPRYQNTPRVKDIVNSDQQHHDKAESKLRFVCSLCGRKFRLKSWLQKHCISKHGDEVEYQDDFEDGSGSSEEEIEEDIPYNEDQEDDIPEELAVTPEHEADESHLYHYVDDFEDYASDEDLDGIVLHARELCDRRNSNGHDETIIDEDASDMLANCRNLLQDIEKQCLARFGNSSSSK